MKTIWINEDTHKRLKHEAVDKETTITEIIDNIVDKYFDSDTEKSDTAQSS